MSDERGRLIADRYRLGKLLGQGGMGFVWHAHDQVLDRDVAVKEVFVPDHDKDRSQRAFREARAAARLNHPGIVTIHDLVSDEGRSWIVMELVSAPSLEDVLRTSGPLAPDRVARIGLGMLEALRAAHAAGILHRDIKPGNVLLPGDRAVITDFGIATIQGDERLTATGQVIGTPAYMAPERMRGESASEATDMWALGATLYAAVTGHPPRGAGAAIDAGPLTPVLEGLLRSDPGARLTAGQASALLASLPAGSAASTGLGRTKPDLPAEAQAGTLTAEAPARVAAPGLPDGPGPHRGTSAGPRRRRPSWLVKAAAGLAAAVTAVVLAVTLTPHSTGSTRPPPPPNASPADCASGTLTLDGSAFGSIAQKAAIAYSSRCKNAHFEFGYGNGKGSAWGVGQLEDVVNDPSKAGSMIAMYDGTTTLARGLTAHPIGMYIYSVIAHTGLYPGSDITLGALKQLFDEPGCVPDKLAVGLQAGSGTRLALLGLLEKVPSDPNIPGTCSPSSGHSTENTYEGALGKVNGTSNAISYMAVDGVVDGHLEIDGHPMNSPNVSVLSIDGVAPTPENFHNGSYHFAAAENLYTVPRPSQLAQSFLTYLPRYLAEHQVPDFITCSSVPASMAAECPAPR